MLMMPLSEPSFAMDSLYGLDGWQQNVIDASKNARLHSNMGNIYFQERNFVSALAEYTIAYNLTYNSSISSTYLYNIATCYMALGDYVSSKNALLGAISKDCINITYYRAYVDTIYALNEHKQELKKCMKDTINPYNKIIAGLIFLKMGKKQSAKIIFDAFIVQYPDMIITADVRNILKTL